MWPVRTAGLTFAKAGVKSKGYATASCGACWEFFDARHALFYEQCAKRKGGAGGILLLCYNALVCSKGMEGTLEMVNEETDISIKQWLPLIGLTCSAFVFNTSEFMPIGLLTDIARSFSISEATAGIMISVYAWGVMILSLPLMVFASRFEYKRMLLGVVGIFALGQFLSAIAPNYPILVCARLVVACAHAVFWSVASIMATRLVSPRHGALAISMIATGSSIAQIFGLPLGRAIGLAVGWRMTFGVVGAIALIIILYQMIVFPAMEAGERFTLSQLPALLRNPFLIALYGVTIFMATGYYVGYSYIEPFMQQVAHLEASTITLSLTCFGLAGLFGSWLFGRFFDGHRFPFLSIALSGVALSIVLMHAASVSVIAIFVICAIWGTCGTAFNVAFQSELIRHTDSEQSAVAMSIFSGLFNLGIGTGTAIGGAVVSRVSIGAIGYVGGGIAGIGVLLAVTWLFSTIRAMQTSGKKTSA